MRLARQWELDRDKLAEELSHVRAALQHEANNNATLRLGTDCCVVAVVLPVAPTPRIATVILRCKCTKESISLLEIGDGKAGWERCSSLKRISFTRHKNKSVSYSHQGC